MAPRSPIKRTSTQRLIFLGVALLLCAQVGWWLSMQIRETKRLQEARIETLRAGRAEAWQMDSLRILPFYYQPDPTTHSGGPRGVVIEGKLPVVLPTLEERTQAIEQQFPHVAVVPAPVAEDDPPLVDRAAYLTLRQEPLRQMERERRRAIWLAAGEGALMAVGVLAGFFLIYRKLTEELDLKLRQRNFIASVTHELKTPIASLRVWIETLFQRELRDEQKLRIHDLMDKDLERLADLVGNMLEVARADAGSLEIRPEPLELGPFLRGVAESMDQRLGPGALGLRLDLARGVWVHADPKSLATVVENLLSNAYKYASEPRETTVTLDGNREEALIVVSDRGKGIPTRELPRLFTRFYRVGDEMTRQVPGTGLGLFLAREIVGLHGGEIRVGSRGLGLGSAFTIRLPRLKRAEAGSSEMQHVPTGP
ncbi:MAG TPA: HAMP domain-containing sensor histidine kinase [Holophagaceae bacterium]|nr:HAMP domain-containing sensor histidine kinase [Holophagaceae bacterium]